MVATSPGSQDPATVLEIHVDRAALAGDGGVNPPLAFCLEGRVTFVRVLDGAELYSCPVQYQSEKRSFTKWAAHDARLFREELERCYHDVGSAIADRVISRDRPGATTSPPPALANK